jgi:predicted RNA binding protein YcfA (HicA-like mRNA interferase family)
LRARDLIALAIKYGWKKDRQRGSHIIMTKAGERSVPIAIHGNDATEVRPDALRQLLRQLKIPIH